jgi:hypothetical protein
VKDYEVLWWEIGSDKGHRVSVSAETPEEPKEKLRAEFGENIGVSIWNEDDANRPR